MTTTVFTFASPGAPASQFDWSTSANWTSGVAPTSGAYANVYISAPSNAGNVSVDNIQGLTITSLNLQQGATVDIASGVTLTSTGGLAGYKSTFGQVVLTGTNTELLLEGSAPAATSVGIQLTGANQSIGFAGFVTGSATTPITGFGASDKIDLTNFGSISSISDINNALTITGYYHYAGVNKVYTGTSTVTFTNFSTIAGVNLVTTSDGNGGTLIEALCFAAGTHILTPTGERLIEDLQEGDLVLTQSGDSLTPLPVKWIGRLRADIGRHPRPETIAPVRIARGAFAEGVPHRDLLVSPEHCILADGRLIAAKCLVNGTTIVQELDRPAIQYFHLETDPHSIVLAEGLPAETYLDTGNRIVFENAGHALLLHPEFHINAGLRRWNEHSCAPLAVTPSEIEPTWRRLADRAVALGLVAPSLATTTDPAPRLLVHGREIAPIEQAPGRVAFLLPAGTEDAILVSRFGSPADSAPYLNDHRRLGVAVRHAVLRAGGEERVIAADTPALTQGWHPVESDAAGSLWRWTEGRAHLPLGAIDAPAILELHLAGAMTYRLGAEGPVRQAA
ncbi:MAG: Hint domain-containing protein [Rhodospirillales bacterium]|nr:Hint domain-containing protein [Rhodospirillales bacterium]